ncbi:MAG: hypothetical protein COW63_00620 [Bacteroidetes bacterium CG18_big_fil_WC_8_21_14_2_50_41_14]|nr:MAG: hypothetical protein COW63_00620 [Bacteroidetes bacterium CG18_big_fil_WC_8_21_14_2_50_41_14]PJB57377.1 MAG: hypothetical protein CO098_11815 [Bacteroidetes bacterium CG_4_9_14_3_um_filter_41_19]
MNFEIYCDESGLEALTKKEAHRFSAIGGIWLPADYRESFKNNINSIKQKHNVLGELKWKKVSPAYVGLYADVVNYFLQTPQLRFRTILLESNIINNFKFNNEDAELGFYKFYYQLLHHWIFDFNNYNIYLDHKVNRDKGRVNVLKKVLHNSNLTSNIPIVQALPSHQSPGIQMADILTGMVASKFNGEITGSAKIHLIKTLENKLGKPIAPTPKWEEKFNVFKINLRGGW